MSLRSRVMNRLREVIEQRRRGEVPLFDHGEGTAGDFAIIDSEPEQEAFQVSAPTNRNTATLPTLRSCRSETI